MKSNNVFKLIISIVLIVALSYVAIFGLTINKKTYVKPAKDIKTGLDINGGVSIVYQANIDNPTKEDLETAKKVLAKRLTVKNIYDYTLRVDENKGYIYLEVPANTEGAKDPLEVVDGIDKTAVVTFKDVDGNVLLSGTDVKSAEYSEAATDSSGLPDPHTVLNFSDEGRQKFKDATKNNIGKQIIIYLDDTVISDPYVSKEIDSPSAIITYGAADEYSKKVELAKETAMLIDSGSLPFTLNIINKEFVGATIGQKALEVSVYAGGIALALVIIFMLFAYKIPGIVAALALISYAAMFIIIMVSSGVVLTLPGIASLILSIGMAVDANVIIFERLKEELKNGRSPERAFDNSFSKALQAIIDGNITTLIVAIFLYVFGIGTIKGFGLVLGLGVVLSMFTSVFMTKFLLKQFIGLAKKYKGIFAVKGAK